MCTAFSLSLFPLTPGPRPTFFNSLAFSSVIVKHNCAVVLLLMFTHIPYVGILSMQIEAELNTWTVTFIPSCMHTFIQQMFICHVLELADK